MSPTTIRDSVVREARVADIPRIVELGSRSLMDGPYHEYIKDNPEQAAKLALETIERSGKILLGLDDDGRIVGLLGFIVVPQMFSGELTAGELMWYVEPEHRKGGIALRLLWAAEKQAKQMGAKRMVFTAPNDEIGALYERVGYSKLEVNFQKVL